MAQARGAHRIHVFGSVARGDSREDSDVDFLVEFDLIGLRLDLKDLLGTEVDVVTPGSLRYMRGRVLAVPL